MSVLLTKEARDVLLHCIEKGASHPQVGFYDINYTQLQLMRRLRRSLRVRLSDLSSALWSANLLSEVGEFEHPRGLTFQDFLLECLPDTYEFDYFFSLIKEKELA